MPTALSCAYSCMSTTAPRTIGSALHFPHRHPKLTTFGPTGSSLEKRAGSRLHGTMPQQTFCAVSGEQRGLPVLEKGLHQYDYLDDGNGTLALSIIRGQGSSLPRLL